MSRRVRVLLTEVGSSSGLVVLPILTALMSWTVLYSPSPLWLGWWQRTGVHLNVTTALVIGPVSAVFAAWDASRARRHAMVPMERLSVRAGVSVVVRSVSGVVVIATACYLVLCGLAFVRTAREAPGAMPWALMIMTWALLLSEIAVGAWCGRMLPWQVSPLVAPVVVYVATTAPVYVEGAEAGWGALFPSIQQPGWDPANTASTSRLALATLWLLGLSWTLLAVAGRSLNRRWRLTNLVTAVVALISAGLLLMLPRSEHAGAYIDPRDPAEPGALTCQSTSGRQVCTWSAFADRLPVLVEATRAAERGYGGIPTPDGRLLLDVPSVAAQDMTVSSMRRYPDGSSLAGDVVLLLAAVPQDHGCPEPDWQLGEVPLTHVISSLVNDRLMLPEQPGPIGLPAYRALKTMPRAEQDHWVAQAVDARSRCQPSPSVAR